MKFKKKIEKNIENFFSAAIFLGSASVWGTQSIRKYSALENL